MVAVKVADSHTKMARIIESSGLKYVYVVFISRWVRRTEQNLIVYIVKSEAEAPVTNNKRLQLLKRPTDRHTTDIITWPLCDSRASCIHMLTCVCATGLFKQEAQLSQKLSCHRDSAMLRVVQFFAKSL